MAFLMGAKQPKNDKWSKKRTSSCKERYGPEGFSLDDWSIILMKKISLPTWSGQKCDEQNSSTHRNCINNSYYAGTKCSFAAFHMRWAKTFQLFARLSMIITFYIMITIAIIIEDDSRLSIVGKFYTFCSASAWCLPLSIALYDGSDIIFKIHIYTFKSIEYIHLSATNSYFMHVGRHSHTHHFKSMHITSK